VADTKAVVMVDMAVVVDMGDTKATWVVDWKLIENPSTGFNGGGSSYSKYLCDASFAL